MKEGTQGKVLPGQLMENLVVKRENINAEKCPETLKSDIRAYQNFSIIN
jgi:hypothetical protein